MGNLTTHGHVQWLCENYQRVNHIEVLLLNPFFFTAKKKSLTFMAKHVILAPPMHSMAPLLHPASPMILRVTDEMRLADPMFLQNSWQSVVICGKGNGEWLHFTRQCKATSC